VILINDLKTKGNGTREKLMLIMWKYIHILVVTLNVI